MNDWVPVLIMALVVVCVTAFLLLDLKFRQPKRIMTVLLWLLMMAVFELELGSSVS